MKESLVRDLLVNLDAVCFYSSHEVYSVISIQNIFGKQESLPNIMCIHVSMNLWWLRHGLDLCLARTSASEVRLQSRWPNNHTRPIYQAHVKAIKSNLNQIPIPILVCVSLCARAMVENIEIVQYFEGHLEMCVCVHIVCLCVFICVWKWVKKKWKEKQYVSKQKKVNHLFSSQYTSHNKHKHSTVL